MRNAAFLIRYRHAIAHCMQRVLEARTCQDDSRFDNGLTRLCDSEIIRIVTGRCDVIVRTGNRTDILNSSSFLLIWSRFEAREFWIDLENAIY